MPGENALLSAFIHINAPDSRISPNMIHANVAGTYKNIILLLDISGTILYQRNRTWNRADTIMNHFTREDTMAGGYEKNKERKEALNALGRGLARRSGSQCELCSAAGVPLTAWEVPPVPVTPDPDHCIFICQDCINGLDQIEKSNPDHWRCLSGPVWSDNTALKVTAVRVLKELEKDHHWAANMLEDVYLEPDEEEWVEKL